MVNRFVVLVAEVVRGSVEDDLSLVEEEDVVEDVLEVRDEVGGDEERRAVFEVRQDGVEDVVAGGWVDTAKRFVQNIEVGFARHDEGELEFFLHTLGHFFEFHVLGEVEVFEELMSFVEAEVCVKVGEEVEILFDGGVFIEVGALGEVGDVGLRDGTERFVFEFDGALGWDEEVVHEL